MSYMLYFSFVCTVSLYFSLLGVFRRYSVCCSEPAVLEAAVDAGRIARWTARHASVHELRPAEVLGGEISQRFIS